MSSRGEKGKEGKKNPVKQREEIQQKKLLDKVYPRILSLISHLFIKVIESGKTATSLAK